MEVVGEPFKDPNDTRNISWAAKVKFVKHIPEDKQVSLAEIKKTGTFADFKLVRLPRLSTMDCPDDFVVWLLKNIN